MRASARRPSSRPIWCSPADAAGAAYWTQQLASGAQSRADMVVAIEHSPEYDTTQLVGVFNAINSLGNLWS